MKKTMKMKQNILKHLLLMTVMMTVGAVGAWGQKVPDGVYYIKNVNSGNWYLWPSVTTNSTTGNQYLTTFNNTSATAGEYNNVEYYPAFDNAYSHWVVKNVDGGYIQLISPRLNKYVVIRQKSYGDRDVWLADKPAAEDIDYTYFVLNNDNSPYKISPKPGLNSVTTTSGYSFNSAAGKDREWLTWTESDDKNYPRTGESRQGLIQCYSGGTPTWSFTSDLLAAPAISDVDESTNTFTITDANSLPTGYTIRYTTDGTAPTATTGTVYSDPVLVADDWTVKAVVVRYGIVLTEVATKAVSPLVAKPLISFDNSTNKVSINCATAGAAIYYNTGDGSQADPTPSTGTLYNAPFDVTTSTTVKAISILTGVGESSVATLAIAQVATPTIQNNGSNAISITCATAGATIYYTTDGSTPTTSSTEYTGPLTENVSNVTIKAIAVKENMITSAVGSGSVMLQCATPVIIRNGMSFSIACSLPSDATIYYSLDGTSPTTAYSEAVDFTVSQLPMTVSAVAKHADYTDSGVATFILKNGDGTVADPYLIYSVSDFANFISNVNAGTTSSACYKLETDVSASGASAITTAFTGTFDGGLHTISGLGHALFNTINGGTVKNVILDNVNITTGTNVGAIANEVTGTSDDIAAIYNCGILSGSVSGSGYVGGLVGQLGSSTADNCYARVINCFSYANITGGTYAGGIVGYNYYASKSNDIRTMVMNCMMYGNITGGTNIAPVYNGEKITNLGGSNGLNNYNYFSYEDLTATINTYNCALGVEKRSYLQRFEFYRNILNSNRELACWYSTGSTANARREMAKWVLETADRNNSNPYPYPILKVQAKYPSIVNIDAEHATTGAERNKGGKLGTLAVTIEMDDGEQFEKPEGATITTRSLTLNITDKDPEHFNFNYYKVQLPYYNDVGTKNYTGNRVVTGWMITSITGGTAGTFSVPTNDNTPADAPYYNYADRNCTDKDLYSVSGRIFNQGDYWDVPEGVTAITIKPYWAKAAYVADDYRDVVYNTGMDTKYNVETVAGGQWFTNGTTHDFTFKGETLTLTVYNSISNAVSALSVNNSHTVNDYAVVLVGNYHHYSGNNVAIGDSKVPYTVTSVDFDEDNEPDYSLIMRFDGRAVIHPVKYDFLCMPGFGMAQKSTGGTGSYNFGIPKPDGWFEVTNTALFRVTQMEYSPSSRAKKPIILHGGVIEQWVSTQGANGSSGDPGDRTSYFHMGDNVWFKEFHIGVHQDYKNPTPHPPVSVTGGDYDEFYLTGLYRADANNYNDNAECYINGGRFGIVAGAGMEGIGHATNHTNGNITWQIDHADMDEFYGGGINAAKPLQGNISTTISNSHVGTFCGGPKFGDMESERTVTTNATNCTFGTFFGAGYGGTSYSRYAPSNKNNVQNVDWNAWVRSEYKQDYNSTYQGVSTQLNYQFIPMSGNASNVARLWVEFAKFSLAKTNNVTSNLTGCTVTGNFYGGGSLGKVAGNAISTLDGCTVNGNVFGAGFSASLPTVEVDSIGFRVEPYYYTEFGTYRTAVKGETTTYTWEHGSSISIDKTNHVLYTTENIEPSNLGSVEGNVILTIKGNSVIGTAGDTTKGNVFGGGESSYVTPTIVNNNPVANTGNTTVNIEGNTEVHGNVFGGGDQGVVEGSAEVNIKNED